ncbi:MAG TPA: RidA family protein [Sneathiellales bacterium]|nr:RidA family protein [Sneathiellales bacterium]
MSRLVDARLEKLEMKLPIPAAPVANYVPFVVTGNLVFVSGQGAVGPNGLVYLGRVGDGISLEDGQKSARMCALNLIAQVKVACGGDLDRVVRCVRLGGFVNCTDEFTDQPKVINGASDLMVDVFGDAGRHARTAVGVNVLPLGLSVEVDGVFEIS